MRLVAKAPWTLCRMLLCILAYTTTIQRPRTGANSRQASSQDIVSAAAVVSGQTISPRPQACQDRAYVLSLRWEDSELQDQLQILQCRHGRCLDSRTGPMAPHWCDTGHDLQLRDWQGGIPTRDAFCPTRCCYDRGPPQPGAQGERPLQQLSVSQLRMEITRLERHILDLPQEGYVALRDALETSLHATKTELMARKPEGQALDQAVARHKQAVKARQLAQTRLEQALGGVRLATEAVESTKMAEKVAAQEVTKQRSAISEYDHPIAGPTVPTSTVVGLYRILQHAQLPEEHLRQVADLLGTRLPPAPPAATMPPATGHPAGVTNGDRSIPDANGVQQHGPAAAMPHLEHPARLASQLLASTPPHLQPKDGTHNPSARKGRSPAPRRPLPARGGAGDFASTYRQSSNASAATARSSRSASRSMDRGRGPHTPPESARRGALSPTLPASPALQQAPSSLQGVAPGM